MVSENSPLDEDTKARMNRSLLKDLAERDKRIAELEAALTNLNAEIDAFWNEVPEFKYVGGRMNDFYCQRITQSQIASRVALKEPPAGVDRS